MEEKINYRKELENARQAVAGIKRDGGSISLFWEICCGDVLLAEENAGQSTEWENASLAAEMIDIAEYLEGYDHMLNQLHTALSRMEKILFDHPRLKLRLLELHLLVLHRIESLNDHELGITEDVQSEIRLYRYNIEQADKGNFENIQQTGHLKHDPIEWSAEYEKVIDKASRKIEELLQDTPRGMGFCFAYWHTKREVLSDDYGIEWRSPNIMNPGVIFD